MLIWLNGAFGAGKTKVGHAIVSARPAATLVDPEQIGFLLRRLLPKRETTGDFQDLPLWRELTVRILMEAAATSTAPVVVPMTLVDLRYFEEVIGGLRTAGVDLRHFTLTASPDTLRRRLRRRLGWPGSRRWALARVERTGSALADSLFAEHIDTERRSVREIAALILQRTGA
jgi:chloramphenicol 3-O-phosphotransferase